jgi:hypothetical protein
MKHHTLEFTSQNYGRWNDAFAYATAAAAATASGNGDYDLIGQNCYDFVDSVLTEAGFTENTAYKYMHPNSNVYQYGKVQDDLVTAIENFQSMLNNFMFNEAAAMNYLEQYLNGYYTFTGQQDYSKVPGYAPELQDGDILVVAERVQQLEQETWISPIALDLGGDGFEIIDLADSSATFDYYGRDAPLKTAWLGPTDGFLVLDSNEDGQISDLSEMFGGRQFGEGFDKLRGLDPNQDGVLDSSDPAWADLRIWIDANSDGMSTAAELHTLDSLGVTSLSLASSRTSISLGDAFISEISHAETAIGDVDLADIFFRLGGLALEEPLSDEPSMAPELVGAPQQLAQDFVQSSHSSYVL